MSLSIASGVAMVPCALEQEILLSPHQHKLQSLKWKLVQKWGRSKTRTMAVIILFFFEGNITYLVLEMNSRKL